MIAPLKPAQAECQQCERLFCFFYRFKRPIFCGQCIGIRRAADHAADNEFHRAQRRKQAAVRAYEQQHEPSSHSARATSFPLYLRST